MVGTRSAGQSLSAIAAYLATATLAAGVIATSQPMTLTQTWNAAGVTFRGKENVFTITAAAAGSTVERWLGGAAGTSVLASIRSDGVLGGEYLGLLTSGTLSVYLQAPTSGNIVAYSGGGAPLTSFGFGTDLYLFRDAANTLAQRNGTNAQTKRLYFSYTDASNYTRLALKTATTLHTIETESAGTGEANIDLALVPKGTGRVRFGTHSALAAETVSGYITIKDAGGTERKIAVVS